MQERRTPHLGQFGWAPLAWVVKHTARQAAPLRRVWVVAFGRYPPRALVTSDFDDRLLLPPGTAE